MIKGIYRNNTALSRLFIFIGLVLFGFGLSTILSFLTIQLLFGLDVMSHPELLTNFSNPESISALKFMQFMNSAGIFIFPVLAFAYLTSEKILNYLSMDEKPKIIHIIITILIMISCVPLINFMVEINGKMILPDYLQSVESWMRSKEDSAEVITRLFLKMDDNITFLINLIVIGFIPAIGEELLFRGLIQKRLSNKFKNHHLAIWITAFLFSAMHLQFYGFLPRFFLGAMFGYLFVWSGSIWMPIIAHLINNGGAVILQYALGEEYMEAKVDKLGAEEGDLFYLAISLAVLGILMKVFYNSGDKSAGTLRT